MSALRVEELRGWDREDRAPKLTAKQVRERFTAGILLGALYLRISEDDYLTEYGVERQEKDGTAFLAAQGFPAVGETMSLTHDASAVNGEIVDER